MGLKTSGTREKIHIANGCMVYVLAGALNDFPGMCMFGHASCLSPSIYLHMNKMSCRSPRYLSSDTVGKKLCITCKPSLSADVLFFLHTSTHSHDYRCYSRIFFPAKFIQKRYFQQWKKSQDNQVKNDMNECYQIHVFLVNENKNKRNENRIIAVDVDVDYLNH